MTSRLARRLAVLVLLALARGASGQGLPEATEADGPAYRIASFELRYVRDNPLHPSLDDLLAIEVPLGRTTTGWVVPRPGIPAESVALADLPLGAPQTFHASGLQRVLEAIRDALVDRALIGVYVAPEPTQILPTGEDLRADDTGPLIILVTTGIVTEMRSLAAGERIDPAERVDNPVHRRILERSPVRPFEGGDAVRRDLLRRDVLDDYVFHLSRHPGRRVDIAVAAGVEPGSAALDYSIIENPVFVPYVQVSNTGTPQTDRIRTSLGFFHTQLTNHDDILSFDYSTAGFDESHAVRLSYDRPFENDRIRWKVYGGASKYTADQVGFFGEDFRGDSWHLGAEIVANVLQDRELFVDVVGGLRLQHEHVDNRAFLIEGREDFVFPYVGVRFERNTEIRSTEGAFILEFQAASVDDAEVQALGRTDADDRWMTAQWSILHAVFLEPLHDPEGWADPSTPETSTLAHELALSLRGQWTFGDRVVPQSELIAGGLFTVRGYPESVVAGDSGFIGTIEYRYHVPLGFPVEQEPTTFMGRPFRWAPQHVYGRPDWDFIVKGFLDVGRVLVNDRFFFEDHHTLVGVGVGVELQLRRNLNARVDWGFALEPVDEAGVHGGSNRLHFVVTWLF